MNISNDRDKQIMEVAFRSIQAAQDSLIMKLRYLDAAVYALKPICKTESFGISTDGTHFFFEPRTIVRRCRNGLSKLTHDYLHVIMHCIFSHNRVTPNTDAEIWNLACDMAVEDIISNMTKTIYPEWYSDRQLKELREFKSVIGEDLTAERIYEYLMRNMPRKLNREKLNTLFHVDEHADWYKDKGFKFFENEEDEAGSMQMGDGGEDMMSDMDSEEGVSWEQIADTIKMTADMGALNDEEPLIASALRTIEDDVTSYSEFLSKFTASKEVMRVDDASFDYIFYTYGMELYGDMPLIEPLEVKEDKIIDELVVVIDSSASTSGELVEHFIKETFGILQDENSLDKRFVIRLLQCDKEIREDVILHNKQEAMQYLKSMKIKGQGGTDFRAAFEYVNELIHNGAFKKLKGLVYFTDGKGTFPEKKPSYETAFVFADIRSAKLSKVPFWAMKTVLGEINEY